LYLLEYYSLSSSRSGNRIYHREIAPMDTLM